MSDQLTARAAVVRGENWRDVLDSALRQTSIAQPDLAILFASGWYSAALPEMVRSVLAETGASALVGCSGQGVIGTRREIEGSPALALLTASLPGASLRVVRFSQESVERCEEPADWIRHTAVPAEESNGWLVLADPFRMDCEGLVTGLGNAYPGVPILGGLASAVPQARETYVLVNGEVYDEGGVGLSVGGAYRMLSVVSQGCEPIGDAWTITAVEGNQIRTISNRPAYEVLVDTFEGLTADLRERARGNLLIGLAANEYRDEFHRGDYLIRNLTGLDRQSGGLAISAVPRVGQTVQFQIRDAAAADEDFEEQLERLRPESLRQMPVGGVLCSCNGRGTQLFQSPDHDASAIARRFGDLPIAGLFCSGEIGPVGTRPFLHGFTASLALFVPA